MRSHPSGKLMPKIDRRIKKLVWICSSIAGVSIIVFSLLVFWGTIAFDDLVFFAVVTAVFPPAILNYVEYRWRKAIDEHLPDLFRSVVQAQETGRTLPQALEEASNRDFGPLTGELRKMTVQMSWGLGFEDALLALGRRVNTLLVQRSIPMIIEAGRSGGQAEKVFDSMGKFIQTTLLLDKERRTQTRPYIAIIYVAFFVFLFTITLLFRSFFLSNDQLPILGTALMSPEAIKRVFFHMMSIQGFFGGLVAGKMGEGAIIGGLKHSLVLMLCGYIVIKLFL